ncbi:MAG TPA: hypothetical protein PKD10_09895 [Paracoccaceae bacterium]|nr:hypothetical protein [Paracoccaceae bacterium]
MTSAFTDPRSPGEKSGNRRPDIWAGGKRRAGIPAGVLWRHCRGGARDWAIPRVEWLALQATRAGRAVEDGAGTATVARIGRAAAVLPPRRHVAATGIGLGRLLTATADVLAGPPPVEPLALRPWDGAPGTLAPAAPPPEPAAVPAAAAPVTITPAAVEAPAPMRRAPEPLDASDRSTLDAIREAIRAPIAPQRPARMPRPPPPPPPPPRGAEALPDLSPPEPYEPGPLMLLGARGVALVALGLCLPVGAVLTLRTVLRGEGLED